MGRAQSLHDEPAEGVVGRRTPPRRTTSASATCRASTATTRSIRRCSRMLDGQVQGLLRRRREPGRRQRQRAAPARRRCASLDWLVVRDMKEIESAAFWYDSPEIDAGELAPGGHRHRGVLPPRRRAHREGRLLHEHPAAAAVAREGGRAARRLPLGPALDLRPRPAHPRASCAPRPTRATGRSSSSRGTTRRTARTASRDADAVLQEIGGRHADGTFVAQLPGAQGRRLDDLRLVAARRHLQGRREPARAAQAAHRAGLGRARVGVGVAGRHARMLYNRASADPDGQAVVGAQALRLVGRRGGTLDRRRPPGLQARTSRPTSSPSEDANGHGRAPRHRAVHRPPRRPAAGSARRPGSSTARCPTHYEPHESPFAQPALRPGARTRCARRSTARTTRYNPSDGEPGADVFPFVDDDLPAHRAPHRGRHVADGAVPRRAAARDVLRGRPGARRRARARARRLGDDRHRRARRSRRACSSPTGSRPLRVDGPRRAPDRRAVPLGPPRARHRRRGQRADPRSCSTSTSTSRSSRR